MALGVTDLKKGQVFQLDGVPYKVVEYAQKVMDGKAKWPTMATPTGVTPADTTGGPPKTWAEARAASAARTQAAGLGQR